MIQKRRFLSLSKKEQYQLLRGYIGDIPTDTNKALMLCQRLLAVIEDPSTKLLEYIFDVVDEQLQEHTGDITTGQQEKTRHLLEYIRTQESKDKETTDTILDQLDMVQS